ncbi:hypothetical protein ACQPW1_26365 [Nocardia sp. CA-128927]|uniref:hypothetical protein n=1 Tax=Nocardia sp. CA-128927 TaxID=3239975 RepID=UPI003D972300
MRRVAGPRTSDRRCDGIGAGHNAGSEFIASLDEGTMWPTAFALLKLTAADEAKIGELVQKAAG